MKCSSCDGTGRDLYDGVPDRDCQVCSGRGMTLQSQEYETYPEFRRRTLGCDPSARIDKLERLGSVISAVAYNEDGEKIAEWHASDVPRRN